MKSTSLKSTLVICLSICRIVRKKMQFGCLWVQNKISGSISKKKSNLNSSNLEKRYQITILCLLSIFQTWDLKKSLVKIPGDQQWFESSKKARKHEITTFWIENVKNAFVVPGHRHHKIWRGKCAKINFKLAHSFFQHQELKS